MTREDWVRLKALFGEALDLPPSERDVFLNRECQSAPELRIEIDGLLAHHEQATDFLENSVRDLGLSLSLEAPEPAAEQVGHYRLIREINRGGMGTVYLAERADEQFEQQVAIKVIKRGMDSDDVLRRFLTERQILARLQHPNIAALLDGGVTDEGRPYFVMEYVEGLPIGRYCADHDLDTIARIDLFRSVCAAVQYAHQNLVIHRDLKPSNILVTEDGTVKLLDFGIAKVLHAEGDEGTQMTHAGLQLLTPAYASPEQIRREPLTTASDVYSLGVLLYELLAGTRPYDTRSLSPTQVERVVCEDRPTRPSAAATRTPEDEAATGLGGATAGRKTRDTRRLAKRLRGDLDTIILAAMRKEPERRYSSVKQLSDDLRLHLEGRPVVARHDSWSYRTGKFIVRHRWGTAAAAVLVIVLAAGGAALASQSVRISRERDRATQISDLLIEVFQSSDPRVTGADTVTARQLLDRGVSRVRALKGRDEVKSALIDVMGLAYHSLGLYEQAGPLMEEALSLKRSHFGPDHPETATSLNNLGNLLQVQGRLDDAEPYLRQALAIREAELDDPSPELAQSLNNLSQLLLARRDFEQTEAYLVRAVEMQQRLYEAGHPDLAQGLNNLGLLYHLQGRYEDAVPFYRESLEMQRAVLASPHPDVAQTTNNLGLVLQALGHYAEAEPLYLESLEMRRALLGEEHPRIVVGLNNVGLLLFERGDYELAGELYEEALDLADRVLGRSHPQTATLLNNVADVRREQGNLAAAGPLYDESYAIRLRTLGAEHPHVAYSLNGMALLRHAEGDLEAADSLYRAAVALRREVLGDRHPDLAVSLHGWAALEVEQDETESAETRFREALSIRTAALPDGHPLLAESLLGLGALLTETDRASEAEPLLAEAVDIRTRVFGQAHPRTTEAQRALAACRSVLENG